MKNSIIGDRDFTVDILPDGEVLLPRDDEISSLLAEALHDDSAKKFCDQSKMNEVLIGKRMCG